jgi:hypothetical protein
MADVLRQAQRIHTNLSPYITQLIQLCEEDPAIPAQVRVHSK